MCAIFFIKFLTTKSLLHNLLLQHYTCPQRLIEQIIQKLTEQSFSIKLNLVEQHFHFHLSLRFQQMPSRLLLEIYYFIFLKIFNNTIIDV